MPRPSWFDDDAADDDECNRPHYVYKRLEGLTLPGKDEVDSILSFAKAGYTQILWIWCEPGDLSALTAAFWTASEQLRKVMPIHVRTLKDVEELHDLALFAEFDTPIQQCKDIAAMYVVWLHGGCFADLKLDARIGRRCVLPRGVSAAIATEPVKRPGLTNRCFLIDHLGESSGKSNTVRREVLHPPSSPSAAPAGPSASHASLPTSLGAAPAGPCASDASLPTSLGAAPLGPCAFKNTTTEFLGLGLGAAPGGPCAFRNKTNKVAPGSESPSDPSYPSDQTLAQVWLFFFSGEPKALFFKECFRLFKRHAHENTSKVQTVRRRSPRWDTYQRSWMTNVTLCSDVLKRKGMLGETVMLLPPRDVVPLPAWLSSEFWETRLGGSEGNFGYHVPSPAELADVETNLALTFWTKRQGWTSRMRQDLRDLYLGPDSPITQRPGPGVLRGPACEFRMCVKSAIADWGASLGSIYPASAVFRVLAAAHSILDAGWADVMCRPALGLSSPYGEKYAGIIAFVVLLFSWQWIFYEFVSWRPELLDLVQPGALDSESREIAERVFRVFLARFTSEAPQTRF